MSKRARRSEPANAGEKRRIAAAARRRLLRLAASSTAEAGPVTWTRDELHERSELEAAIRDYLDRHNADPKPFVWTKTAATILAKERRALEKLQSLTGCQPTESEH